MGFIGTIQVSLYVMMIYACSLLYYPNFQQARNQKNFICRIEWLVC